jgi:anti-sigma factor RsiW
MTASIPPQPADDPTLLVHAYLDGELDPANALAVEGHIAADPDLAAERDSILMVRQLLRQELKRDAAPSDLRSRLETAIGFRRPLTPPSWLAFAAAIAVVIVLSSGSTWFVLGSGSRDHLVNSIVASHIRGLMASQSVDVASSDRHTVKPWFNGRITEAPRVVDLASAGYPLVGGRVDVVDLKPVPTLVYRRNQHVISLMAVMSAEVALGLPVRGSVDGYNVVTWSEDGMTYWAVSDVNSAELKDFAARFRAAPSDQTH